MNLPSLLIRLCLTGLTAVLSTATIDARVPVELGERPLNLVRDMDPGPLKARLLACRNGPFQTSELAIGHRGAPLRFAEHTRESYLAAARQGAGVIECDVTFTRDRALVCRHAQCDLHSTTNILATPLAGRCREPFRAADPATGEPAGARCCTSELTLAEFKSLCGRRDVIDPTATSVAGYLAPDTGTCGTLMTHAESITLFDELGVAMTPELKAPEVPMPHGGEYGQIDYADALIADYRNAGIDPDRVYPQSFDLADVEHWIRAHPAFGRQAVYLDGRAGQPGFDPARPEDLEPTMVELAERGVRTVAPPLWVLITTDGSDIVPSRYARAARAAGLQIVTWTLERPGDLADGGGWYYRSVADLIDNDGDVYSVVDVLVRDVGVRGIFSDWPATVTYYANCPAVVSQ
jgi:glycerophosphoryl diester phosphodiesterase